LCSCQFLEKGILHQNLPKDMDFLPILPENECRLACVEGNPGKQNLGDGDTIKIVSFTKPVCARMSELFQLT
jgi:hypothetical protein